MGGKKGSQRGIDPTLVILCRECAKVYVGALTAADRLHPAGTDGSCTCGSDEFETVSDGARS